MIEWFMDRYRGTPGLFGRIVHYFDVRYLKRFSKAAKKIARQEGVVPRR
jgi:hypothetical protein